jgi:hypothetical protein
MQLLAFAPFAIPLANFAVKGSGLFNLITAPRARSNANPDF